MNQWTTKGSLSIPKWMNFRKISERPLSPPRPFFGKFHCDFFRKPVAPALNLQWNFSDRKWPPPFLKFFWKFMTKKAVSNAKKIAMKFFRSEMTPPLSEIFRKFIRFSERQASLSRKEKEMIDLGYTCFQIRQVYTQKSYISCANLPQNRLNFAKLCVLLNFLPQPPSVYTRIYPWHFATLLTLIMMLTCIMAFAHVMMLLLNCTWCHTS